MRIDSTHASAASHVSIRGDESAPTTAAAREGGVVRGRDTVELSAEGLALAGQEPDEGLAEVPDEEVGATDARELGPEERAELSRMKARDREVRAHENAHKAAAGGLATGGPRYETERGPDGRDYAVGGEVGIELREGSSPEETVRLAQRAQRSALAPAQPSSQDRRVAAQAAQMEQRARQEQRADEDEAPTDGARVDVVA